MQACAKHYRRAPIALSAPWEAAKVVFVVSVSKMATVPAQKFVLWTVDYAWNRVSMTQDAFKLNGVKLILGSVLPEQRALTICLEKSLRSVTMQQACVNQKGAAK